ncbi:hypothetical protein J6590_014870 [Homalodisca vitripennis]|nr:hypothetical protein J6590_014870 [Homalodisca vitripennis]
MVWRTSTTLYYYGMQDPSMYPFTCQICGKAYKYKKNLIRHVKHECNMEPKFTCTLCPFKSKQHGHLKIHMLKKHSMNFNIALIP